MAKLDMSVEAAVLRDLADLERRAPDLARSALAAAALSLARELDSYSSATSKSMCARALVETMAKMREWAPEVETKDWLDDLSSRRAARLGGSATKNLLSS